MECYSPIPEISGISPVSQTPSNQITDLLLGVPAFGASTVTDVPDECITAYHNTPVQDFTLTNGTRAQSIDYTDPAYTHFTHGTGRTIIYKLPNLSAVTGASTALLLDRALGIRLANRISVFLSVDGVNWQRIYNNRSITNENDKTIVQIQMDFDNAYKASWVRFDIGVMCHVWMDHLSLYGTTAIPETAIEPVNDGNAKPASLLYPNKYPSYDDLCGIKNIWLAYNCMPPEVLAEEALAKLDKYTVEEAKVYVGYYNKEGKLEDTFFDSALFLPYSRFTYSKHYKSADGWKYYIDNLFADGENVDALNEAVGIVGKELGVDFKLKLFFSIFHTAPHYGSFPEKFGDIDDDGIDEDLSKLEDKIKVTKWMIDTQIARLNEKERKNLELSGFYWFEEEIASDNPYEYEVMEFASNYVHSLGYKLIWIPYYQAAGYTEWQENGFDVACMQPNYAFNPNVPLKRLYDNAAQCKRLGMCYELEINQVEVPSDSDKYKEYLEAGVSEGFMHTIKMYYQDCRAFWIAYNSKDEFIRSVYDDTYLFAKEKLVKPMRMPKQD
ncbi:MAG: DUF4855 domain-containing protein [Clostridia bacterium]|nr:DUF4855 domain-containing protein [Clostridia bacterium]